MKKLLHLIILLAAISIIAGCSVAGGGDGDLFVNEPVIEIPGKWTVMVWLDGDNNLEGPSIIDINEMEKGLYKAIQENSIVEDNIDIIVQFDRYDGGDSNIEGGFDGTSMDWDDTRRYRILPDSENDYVIRSERLDTGASELGEVNMGDASELQSFINYCKTNFNSDNYALILWNHGGGVRGTERSSLSGFDYNNISKAVCWDDTDGGDCLYIGEITDTLESGDSVDFLGFDACLMGMAEVAYEYRSDSSDFGAMFMAASPATEQGDGWEYQNLFSCFTGGIDDGVVPAELFAKAVVAEYKRAFYYQSEETMSAYDLGRISDVKDKLDDLASIISSYKNTVENIRGEAPGSTTMEYFDEYSVGDWINYPHFDLYDLASRISSNASLSSAARSAADALKLSVDSCVVKSWAGSSYSGHSNGTNGLGIFFPDGDVGIGSGEVPDFYLYEEQWWYTSANPPEGDYGRLDFCDFGSTADVVETWKELLESWYDPSGTYNSDTF